MTTKTNISTFSEHMFTQAPIRRTGSGLLRALTAPHGPDRFLELVAPRFSSEEVRAEVIRVTRPTTGSTTLQLLTNRNWHGFRAGQSVNVTVEINGRRYTRCYSPACSQHGRRSELELTIRAHEHGLVSSHLYRATRPGMVLGLSQPMGDFVLPDPRPQRVTLLSGGSGITPVLSMLRTLIDEDHPGPVTFVHYTPQRREHPYRTLLERLQRRRPDIGIHVIGTREGRAPGGGHLTRRQLLAFDRECLTAPAYVCGPPALIAAARSIWARAGAPEQVHSESFLPATVPAGAGEGRVRFARSDVEASCAGLSLLEQAEQAGLSPVYGCRMGICHTCTTRKLAGRVRDIRSGAVSSADAEDVQLCVSVPAGDVELDL